MRVVMILAPPAGDERLRGRTGDAFDTALVETLRTMDAQGDSIPVLVPWSPDLAPLVTAALSDGAPSFDPEGAGPASSTRSRMMPYRVSDEDSRETDTTYWRASHLSLTWPAPLSLPEALAANPPTDLLVLGIPKDAWVLAKELSRHDIRVFCFGSLVAPHEVAEALNLHVSNVDDLEGRLMDADETSDEISRTELERDAEETLERYVPYALLVQDAFDEFLPGDDQEDERIR